LDQPKVDQAKTATSPARRFTWAIHRIRNWSPRLNQWPGAWIPTSRWVKAA